MIEFLSLAWKLAALYLGIIIYLSIIKSMYSSSILSFSSMFDNLYWKTIGLLTLALIAFPILSFIHYHSQEEFSPYLYYIEYFITTWKGLIQNWQWVIVLMLIPTTCRGAIFDYTQISMDLQINRLKNEIKRWQGTPYLPPLLYFYILQPPGRSQSWKRFSDKNLLYHFAIDTLRESVYVKKEMKNKKPIEKPMRIRIIPAKASYRLSVYLVMLAGLSLYLIDNNPSSPLSDGYKYALPILCGLTARIIGISLSIMNHATWGKINRKIKKKCGVKEPLITWSDLQGDQPLAKQVIDAWLEVYENQKRKASAHAINHMPELPYTSKEIPIWTDDHRAYVNKFINQKPKQPAQEDVKQRRKSNVVQFKK